jgi:Concanavalin A-like lectin/glucanases superfamily/Divergent InlB B-repeat domain
MSDSCRRMQLFVAGTLLLAHCVVTVEPAQATFYLNGVPSAVNAVHHSPIAWDGSTYLGGDGNADWVGRRMNGGSLDDASFFSRALSEAEIQTIMGGLAAAGLVDWENAATAAAPTFFATNVEDGVYDIGTFGGEMTYEFVVQSNPDETQASMCLIGRRTFGDTQVGLKYEQWNNTGTYGATVFGVADYDYGVATNPGVPTHLAFVSSEDTATTALYVDGILQGSIDSAITLSGLVGIGYGAQAEDGSDFFDDFDGEIFGVAIYDRALSPGQIRVNADAYFGGGPSDPTPPDSPVAVTFGSTIIGAITAAAEMDSYTFSGSAGDTVLIRMSESSSSLDPEIRLYGPDGGLLKSASHHSLAEFSLALSQSGQYTVLAGDNGGTDTGGYGLFLQRLENPGNATSLVFGRTVTGSISSDAEMDSYTFVADAGDTVLVRMSESSSSLDPEIRLYGPDGSLLESASHHSLAEFSLALSQGGQYIVLAGDNGGTDTGGYGLFLQKSPSGIPEPGDSTTGLVAYYPFSGNANDASGNGNHGTVYGATLTDDRKDYPERAYAFDGLNDYINIGNGVKPPLPLTIAMWLKVGNLDSISCVFRNDQVNHGGTRNGIAVFVEPDGSMRTDLYEGFSAPPNRRSYVSDRPLLKQRGWHHLAFVYNDYDSILVYFDATRYTTNLSSDSGGSGMTYSGTGEGAIGHNISNTASIRDYFSGSVDEVWVYDRALSDADIEALSGRPGGGGDTVVVQADVDEAPAGTPVTLTGRAITASGDGVANIDVVIHIETKGTERTVTARTDGSGNFETVWQPLEREAGRYAVWAEDQDGQKEAAEDEFVLFAVDVQPAVVSHSMVAGQSLQARAAIHNLGDTELPGLSAHVEGAPENLIVEPNVPEVLGLEADGSLDYTITALDALALDPEFDVVVSYLQETVARLHVRVTVIALAPSLAVSASSVTADMVRGAQTLVEFQVTNSGGAPTGDLQVLLPEVAWMSLTTPSHITSLDPGESATVVLALLPPEDVTLGLHTGSLVLDGSDIWAEVPFEFNCVSEATGTLVVRAVDELTYHADGKPKIAGAQITVSDPQTGQVIAEGATDDDGIAVLSLTEGYYDIEVTAEDHGTFRTTLRVLAGTETSLTAFLPGQYLTYRWTVIPGDIEDTYDFTVTAVFETDVPVPVVTVEPLMLDLCELNEETTQVQYTITNHGLIAAKDAELTFDDFAGFEFTPLVEAIGDIPAKTSIVVPVLIRNNDLSAESPGPCEDCNQCAIGEHALSYHLTCGEDDLLYRVPFYTKACIGACYERYPGAGDGHGGGSSGYQGGYGNGAGASSGSGVTVPQIQPPDNPPPVMLLPCPSCDARVTIQIDQRMVLTRQGFWAMLELSNNGSTLALEQLTVTVAIDDEDGNPSDHLFGIHPPELTGLGDVDGNSSLSPGQSATAKWLIMALPEAACEEPRIYNVRGELSYVIDGEQVTVPLYPVPITVLPSPALEVKYFLERDVYSDDPFTDVVEPAIPFSLGLMMTNHGCGVARDVRIDSSQPRIIENEKGLLIDFQIIGTRVGASDMTPLLNVELGDIGPEECRVAQWMMQSSLQGQFVEYDANFVHVDGLGDKRLSLVDTVSIHELIHVVRGTCPDDDGIGDFLTNDAPDTLGLPDTVHLSGVCSVEPVMAFVYGPEESTSLSEHFEVTVTVPDVPDGYFYAQWPEPTSYELPLVSVTRSDGVEIPIGENVWVTRRIVREEGQLPYEENLLHVFDCGGPGTYTIRFAPCEGWTLKITSTIGGTVVEPGIGVFPVCEPEEIVVIAEVTDPDFRFVGWTGTAVAQGKVGEAGNPVTTVIVDADYTLEANFGLVPRTLTILSTDGGTVVTPGEGEISVEHGTSVLVEAQADDCYQFTDWTGTAVDEGKVEDASDPNTMVEMDGDYTLRANFERILYTLDILSTVGGSVVAPGEGPHDVNCGEVVPVEAQADECYRFTGWTGTARVTDSSEPNTTVVIDANCTLEANFELISYDLTVTSTKGGSVTVPGEGVFRYDCGTSVAIEAVPGEYAKFTGWSGTAVDAGNVADPNSAGTTVTVDASYTLQANFSMDQHIVRFGSTDGGHVNLTVTEEDASYSWLDERTIQFDHGTRIMLMAMAEPGYEFANWSGTIWSTASYLFFPVDQDYDLTANFVAVTEP